MKPILAYVWQRCWCRLLIAVALLCALAVAHPFVRQSIFGPKIEGIPWCVWENAARRAANPARNPPSWYFKTLEELHLVQPQVDLTTHAPSLWPIYLHLAEDADVEVRRHALKHLDSPRESRPETERSLRQHLTDNDARCRLNAAWALWRSTKDPDLKEAVLTLAEDPNVMIRHEAISLVYNMAVDMPDLFEPLSKLAKVGDSQIRMVAVLSMAHFGKRALPVVRTAFGDASFEVRRAAAMASGRLKDDGLELIPILQLQQDDTDHLTRRFAADALYRLDPKRFAKPATLVD